MDVKPVGICVTHANLDLKLLCLYQAQIIPFHNHQALLTHMCYNNRYNELCLSRKCIKCTFWDFDNSIVELEKIVIYYGGNPQFKNEKWTESKKTC